MDFIKKKEQVLNGEYDALKLYTELTELEKAIKDAKAEILEDAMTEFDKHGEKTVVLHGYEIAVTQSGRYDYSSSSDWNTKKAELKDIETKMQAAYKSNSSVLDNDTGEVFEPASYKSNKASLRLKLKK